MCVCVRVHESNREKESVCLSGLSGRIKLLEVPTRKPHQHPKGRGSPHSKVVKMAKSMTSFILYCF